MHWSQTPACLEVSSNPEDLDYMDQVCLIRVAAKLSRAVALQELSLRPMVYRLFVGGCLLFHLSIRVDNV